MARGESLTRQWNLLKVLQAHRFGVASDELSERLNCSKRQVLRDLHVLQEVGFPIRYDERDFGKRYWTLASGFIERSGLMLTMTEMLSLLMGQKLLTPLTGTVFGKGLTQAMDKLKAVLPGRALAHFEDLDQTLVVKSLAHGDYAGQIKQIDLISKAISERVIIDIRYQPADGKHPLETRLRPYGLLMYEASLYCVGYLESCRQVRTLKLTRFQSIRLSGDHFNRPGTFSLENYVKDSFGIISRGPVRTIRARLTDWAALNVREVKWHDSQRIVEAGNDHVVVEFNLSDTAEFKRWILGFGQHALVLEPQALADEVRSDLVEALQKYNVP